LGTLFERCFLNKVMRKKFLAVSGKFNFLKLFVSFCFLQIKQFRVNGKFNFRQSVIVLCENEKQEKLFSLILFTTFPVFWVFLEVKNIRKSFKLFFSVFDFPFGRCGDSGKFSSILSENTRKTRASNSQNFLGIPQFSNPFKVKKSLF
jgi:hypothetical protein